MRQGMAHEFGSGNRMTRNTNTLHEVIGKRCRFFVSFPIFGSVGQMNHGIKHGLPFKGDCVVIVVVVGDCGKIGQQRIWFPNIAIVVFEKGRRMGCGRRIVPFELDHGLWLL